jgi:hypothetical protein
MSQDNFQCLKTFFKNVSRHLLVKNVLRHLMWNVLRHFSDVFKTFLHQCLETFLVKWKNVLRHSSLLEYEWMAGIKFGRSSMTERALNKASCTHNKDRLEMKCNITCTLCFMCIKCGIYAIYLGVYAEMMISSVCMSYGYVCLKGMVVPCMSVGKLKPEANLTVVN